MFVCLFVYLFVCLLVYLFFWFCFVLFRFFFFFFFFSHGPDDLDHFVNFCNTFHPTIKFTSESSAKEITFLNVMVSIKDRRLHTDLYSKPTDAHQFIHRTSCHPKSTKRSLPYSLAFRLNRICSSQESLQKRITEPADFMKARGYPSSIIKRQISRALGIPRSEALEPWATRSNNTDRIPLVITYHPSLPKPSQILNKHLSILHSSDKCKKGIPNVSMVVYRRNSNVVYQRHMLFQSTLPPNRPPPRGSFACGTCRSCDHKHGKLRPKQSNPVSHWTRRPLSLVPLQVKRTSYTSISPVKLRMWFISSLAHFVSLCMCVTLVAPWKTELLSTVLMSATRGTVLLLDISGNRVTLLTIYLSCALRKKKKPWKRLDYQASNITTILH